MTDRASYIRGLEAHVERLAGELVAAKQAVDEANERALDAACRLEESRRTVEALEARQQEHLKLIAKITRETPYPAELDECRSARRALIAEIGTLRSTLEESRATVNQLRADLALADATNAEIRRQAGRETSATIAKWQDETFGPATTTGERIERSWDRFGRAMQGAHNADLGRPRPNLSRAIRAAEELAELIVMLVADDADPKAVTEVSDVRIVLAGIAAFHGVEQSDSDDAKMKVNRARRWTLTGDGHGQHMKEQP